MFEKLDGLIVPAERNMDDDGEDLQKAFDVVCRDFMAAGKGEIDAYIWLASHSITLPFEDAKKLHGYVCREMGIPASEVRKTIGLINRAYAGNWMVDGATLQMLRAVDIRRIDVSDRRKLLTSAVKTPWTYAKLITEAHRKAGPPEVARLKTVEFPSVRLTPAVVTGLAKRYFKAVERLLNEDDDTAYDELRSVHAEARRLGIDIKKLKV